MSKNVYVYLMICYIYVVFIGKPDGLAMLEGWIVPRASEQSAKQAIALLGAVIMPHNLYLHSALVRTRSIKRSNKFVVKEGNYYFTLEGAISLFVSFLINLCIVVVFAKVSMKDSPFFSFSLSFFLSFAVSCCL